jgi:hypothetical protein
MTRPKKQKADPQLDELDQLIDELQPVAVELPAPQPAAGGMQDTLDDDELRDVDGIGEATFAKFTATKAGDDLVRTVRGAIEWARDQVRDGAAVWRGLCLMFVRMCFNVAPLYPDAITAWNESPGKRRCSTGEARRGHAGFFRGGDHGHVVLCLGRGLCISTDIKRSGLPDVCRLDDIVHAWGYDFLGDVTNLNGERAPRPTKPTARKPELTTTAFRLRVLRKAIVRARENGNHARARRLRDWREAILRRAQR